MTGTAVEDASAHLTKVADWHRHTEPLFNRGRDQPLAAGATIVIDLGNLTQATLEAAVFSDGSYWGDPAWVNHIINRRKAFAKTLEDILSWANQAQAVGNLTREELVAQLEALQSKACAPYARQIDERYAVKQAIGEAKVLITGTFVGNQTASPDFVLNLIVQKHEQWIMDANSDPFVSGSAAAP